ncbi:hypothetical protein SteCoe_6369 [Stentor coeruleus]|uniref:Uncharacterized protein n=1 Tax=Stentor coeruleus TaxID=5963 RepID=A0A1R2CQ65_9CILI|nr:hypothetical protein SteCoe_6369 [Stentor coeruleus]
MLELFILVFIFSSVWIVWLRPIYHTLRNNPIKEFYEYWVILGVLSFLEVFVIEELARDIPYNFIRTMSLFVLSERAIAVLRPKKEKKAKESESIDNMPCDSLPEQIMHIENLNGKTQPKVIEKLLSNSEPSPFQLEKTGIWTSIPKSIRGLTAYKLSVMISGNQIPDDRIESYKESKIPQVLIEMIASPDPGDFENSLLLIAYLTEKSKKLQKVFFELKIFEILQIIVMQRSGNAAACSLSIYRKIFKQRNQAREEFMRSKISEEMIRMLRSTDKMTAVEACQCANDLVVGEDNTLNKQLLKILANQGLYDALQEGLANHGSDNKVKLQMKYIEALINSL